MGGGGVDRVGGSWVDVGETRGIAWEGEDVDLCYFC
jgi:hypothetical protein